ncbi:MAG: VCBS repeat-containing protein [Fibrobacteria bacterium]
MDVDRDGWLDKVAGTFWYRNPGHPRDTVFEVCRDSTQEFVHDMLAADMDGDGRPDILNIDFDGIPWFSVPRDPRCLAWKEHRVSGFSGDQALQMQGGIATGDIDGDGAMDLVQSECDLPNGRVGWFGMFFPWAALIPTARPMRISGRTRTGKAGPGHTPEGEDDGRNFLSRKPENPAFLLAAREEWLRNRGALPKRPDGDKTLGTAFSLARPGA